MAVTRKGDGSGHVGTMHHRQTDARVAAPGEEQKMNDKTRAVTRREVIAAMGAVPVALAIGFLDQIALPRYPWVPGYLGQARYGYE